MNFGGVFISRAIVVAVLLSPGSLLLASTNDAFADRINVAGTNLILFGANTNATKQAGELNHAGNAGGQSVWWAGCAGQR